MARAVVPVLYVAFVLYCVLDVVRSEPRSVRALPRPLWVLLVVFVPLVGGVAWLLAGRPAQAASGAAATRGRPAPRRPGGAPGRPHRAPPKGPDDDPEFLRRLDEQLRRGQDEEEPRD